MWKIVEGIYNSGGNLCLHLVGNLHTYVCAVFGGTGYIQNRDLEFTFKDVLEALLLNKIDMVLKVVKETFDQLDDDQLPENYSTEVLGISYDHVLFFDALADAFKLSFGRVIITGG